MSSIEYTGLKTATMNPEEYRKLEIVERDHWFYRGKRDIVSFWIRKYHDLRSDELFVDAGCGTGMLLLEMSKTCRVLGLDSHDESIAISSPRLASIGGTVIKTDLQKVSLPSSCADVLTLIDVLEHMDDDTLVLEEMLRLVRAGGLILILVPALRFLWSDWDVALHHRRRYTRSEFNTLIERRGVEILHAAFINTMALLPIAIIRLLRRSSPSRLAKPRAEETIPPFWLNSLLHRSFVRPACWSWFHPPAGVSLFAVLRRTLSSHY